MLGNSIIDAGLMLNRFLMEHGLLMNLFKDFVLLMEQECSLVQ
jgi:hypothetical protein